MIKVWGTGNEKRDLLFINDLIDSVKLSIKNQKSKFEIFNIGSGKAISIKNLVKKILKISNKNMLIEFDKIKPTNKFSVSLDCKKAERLIKWKPKHSLEKGIELTINWYKKNLK